MRKLLGCGWRGVLSIRATNRYGYIANTDVNIACSQFYDLSCNNEKLRMQNRDLKGLVNMVGLEYVLELNEEVRKHQPFLFIICKQRRVSPNQIVKLAKYYVLDMIIYQAPNLHSLFLSRVSKFCTYIQNSFHFLAAAAHHSPNEGNTWRFDVEGSEAWNKSIEGEFQRLGLSIADRVHDTCATSGNVREQEKVS